MNAIFFSYRILFVGAQYSHTSCSRGKTHEKKKKNAIACTKSILSATKASEINSPGAKSGFVFSRKKFSRSESARAGASYSRPDFVYSKIIKTCLWIHELIKVIVHSLASILLNALPAINCPFRFIQLSVWARRSRLSTHTHTHTTRLSYLAYTRYGRTSR